MAEFKTTKAKKRKSQSTDNLDFITPKKIPATYSLVQIGSGFRTRIYTVVTSPKVEGAISSVAIKKTSYSFNFKEVVARLLAEASILRRLDHPNIISLRGLAYESNGLPSLIMEKLDYSLGDLIASRKEEGMKHLLKNEILKISFGIAKGLKYLHHIAYILHGDIKSYNILLREDLKTVKICDFGVSLPLTENLEVDPTGSEYVGTECWTAPEILNGNGPVTNTADIWSYGLVLWEMISLDVPIASSIEGKNSRNTSVDSLYESKKKKHNNMLKSNFSKSLDDADHEFGKKLELPAIDSKMKYDKVFELYHFCTVEDYKKRPSAKDVVMFFKNHVYNKRAPRAQQHCLDSTCRAEDRRHLRHVQRPEQQHPYHQRQESAQQGGDRAHADRCRAVPRARPRAAGESSSTQSDQELCVLGPVGRGRQRG